MPYEGYSHQHFPSSPFPFLDSPDLNNPDATTSSSIHCQQEHTMDSTTFSDSVQFQFPQFMCSTAPTLAPGGGAEVLPVGMLNNTNWLINNGFTPKLQEPSFFSSKPSSPIQLHHPYGHPHQHERTPPSAPFEFGDCPEPPHSISLPTPSLLSSSDLSNYLMSSGILANSHLPSHLPSRLTPPILRQPSLLPVSSALGLPVYSASGFDLLSILARVATRPYPRIHLGPVDLTCSFIVVDTRRYDHPIVYCSPTFTKLTGYAEHEVVGRNCRFLQSPNGQVEPGSIRPDSHSAVAHLKKSLSADKECQTVITNYRKDGFAFMNLLTVIPIHGGVSGAPHEENDVVFHVGFQVDLTEQPNAILERLHNGSYVIDYDPRPQLFNSLGPFNHNRASFPLVQGPSGSISSRERKSLAIPPPVISKDLKKMLVDPAFLRSIPLTTRTNVPVPLSAMASAAEGHDNTGGNQLLHLILLEMSPDFIHVVSLKGSFLYVAPSVRRVLGYEPEEMVGGSIADFTHPEDVVPLMRELKESSATGISAVSDNSAAGFVTGSNGQIQVTLRTVDLLFRAKTKAGVYVWVECRGRLHVEPGKGRKAIVLSGRAREMPILTWDMVESAGGIARTKKVSRVKKKVADSEGDEGALEEVEAEQEFWGSISDSMVMLVVGKGVTDVLGWAPRDLQGASMSTLLMEAVGWEEEVRRLGRAKGEYSSTWRKVRCKMRRRDGALADVYVIIYRPARNPALVNSTAYPGAVSPAPLVYQVRLVSAVTYTSGATLPTSDPTSASSSSSPFESGSNIFAELETTRGSSWQYELQQLRFANERLKEEIAAMEASFQSSATSPQRESIEQRPTESQQPSYQRHQSSMSNSPPYLPSSQPAATLPTRTPSIMDSRSIKPIPSSSSGPTYVPRPIPHSTQEWSVQTSPSPFVQRIQQEVMNASTCYYPSTELTSVKRTWSSMNGLS